MHPHETLLRELFAAIAAGDAARAARCHHPDIFVTDPLFPRLRGEDAALRWRLLFEAVDAWRLELHALEADADGGRAEWTSHCRWRGRDVRTRGRSLFAFRQGRICRQYDAFPFWRWARQALGPLGAALGWSGPFKWAVRRSLSRRLEAA